MNRRSFLLTTCGATTAAMKTGWTQGGNPLDRIAVLSWSFRDAFKKTRAKNGWVPDTDLDILDYPQMIADRYHIHNVEVQTMYLEPEASFVRDFKERLSRAKSKLVSIAAEPPNDVNQALGGSDESARSNALAVNMKWIDYAAAIGSPILMINQGSLHDDLGPFTDSAKKLVEYGRTKKVAITAEPRGNSGSKPELLAKVMRDSGMRATPDMGNFSDEARERGLRELIPLAAGTCHTRYNPTRFDLAKIMGIIKELDYKGLYTIEAGFSGNPYDQVQLVLDQIVKYL
jgi:sugar phosphate isomerase/epimerase